MLAAPAFVAAADPTPQPDVARLDDSGFVSWAGSRAITLPPLESGLVESVGASIGAARLVALGEPAHGLHEPLAFRNALFRLLVERQGFTAIALETGLSEARRIDAYVQGGPGDARSLARQWLSWGFGSYAENVALIEWMRSYNLGQRNGRKIRFYGLDLSGGDGSGTLGKARIAIDDVLAFLSRAAPDASTPLRRDVALFLPDFTHSGYQGLSPSDRRRLGAALAGLEDFLQSRRDALVRSSSQEELDWAQRNFAVARRIETMFAAWPAGDDGLSLSPAFHKPAAVRDAGMADNLLWILQQEGPSGRVLAFAHNGHVANAPLRGGIWSVYPQAPDAMGVHLRKALGDALAILAVGSGPIVGAAAGSGPPGTLDRALSQVTGNDFLLDIRQATASPAADAWLGKPQSLRANLATEMIFVPKDAADIFVYFHRVTEARPAGGGAGPATD